MRLLLDTHIALWAVVDDARLPARARELITHDTRLARYNPSVMQV